MSHSPIFPRLVPGLLVLTLAACAGQATPQRIGSYPRGGAPAPAVPETIPHYPPAPPNLLVIYNATLELEVSEVDAAARRATQLAYDYGGYLVSSQAWFQGEQKHATLTVAVPATRFEPARRALLDLGLLLRETVSGELTYGGGAGWATFSHLTLQLRPAPDPFTLPRPRLPAAGWNPARTFERAFAVFAGIFSFLVDALIWATVVIGPFVLVGLGLRAVVRRVWRRL